jgi:hypothetical protein
MNDLERLQAWYQAQCNGKWEHTYGVAVGTLDNPGWSLSVDLTGTPIKQAQFKSVAYGVDADDEPMTDTWHVCKVENDVFVAFGGPDQLTTMIDIFLSWADQA